MTVPGVGRIAVQYYCSFNREERRQHERTLGFLRRINRSPATFLRFLFSSQPSTSTNLPHDSILTNTYHIKRQHAPHQLHRHHLCLPGPGQRHPRRGPCRGTFLADLISELTAATDIQVTTAPGETVRRQPRAVQQACQRRHRPAVLRGAVLLRRGRVQQCLPDGQHLRRAALKRLGFRSGSLLLVVHSSMCLSLVE